MSMLAKTPWRNTTNGLPQDTFDAIEYFRVGFKKDP